MIDLTSEKSTSAESDAEAFDNASDNDVPGSLPEEPITEDIMMAFKAIVSASLPCNIRRQ